MSTNPTEPLAPFLKHWRDRAGLTQKQLAAAADLSISMIGQAEAGDRHYGHDTAQRVADALGLTADERSILLSYVGRTPAQTMQAQIDEVRGELVRLGQVVAMLAAEPNPDLGELGGGASDPQ